MTYISNTGDSQISCILQCLFDFDFPWNSFYMYLPWKGGGEDFFLDECGAICGVC